MIAKIQKDVSQSYPIPVYATIAPNEADTQSTKRSSRLSYGVIFGIFGVLVGVTNLVLSIRASVTAPHETNGLSTLAISSSALATVLATNILFGQIKKS